jgi:peptidoglycan/LPS O-acetylase OafA/YrhL
LSASSPALTPPAPTGTAQPGHRRRLGEVRLDARRNSLNLLRLVLAVLVLVSHGYPISGRPEPLVADENLGTWAVFGFFAISGYLIAGSRFTRPLGHFLVNRAARIFPAFLVNLVVTVLVFAPVGFWAAHRTLDGIFGTVTTPFAYLASNVALRMGAYDVAGTPLGVPLPGVWNGSLWSLYYEFLCYLVLAILGSVAVFRRSAWAMAVAFALSVAFHAGMTSWMRPYTQDNTDALLMAKLLPFFLGGALLYLLRDRLPLTWPLALAAAVGTVGACLAFSWGPQLAGVFIAYLVLWFGAAVPSPALIQRHDISYGMYIYAFPVQQLLAVAGAYRWHLAVFDLVAVLCTVPLATASWLLVERRVMRRARASTAAL